MITQLCPVNVVMDMVAIGLHMRPIAYVVQTCLMHA